MANKTDTVKIPVLNPGDAVILFSSPTQTVGQVADVLVAHSGGNCDVVTTVPLRSSARPAMQITAIAERAINSLPG